MLRARDPCRLRRESVLRVVVSCVYAGRVEVSTTASHRTSLRTTTLRPAREAVPVSRAALFQCKKPVRPVTFPKDVYTSFGITRDSLFFFLNVRQAGRCRDGKKDLFSSRKNFHSDLSLDETTR